MLKLQEEPLTKAQRRSRMEEPTSMLDHAVKEDICEIIQQIFQTQRFAFLMGTHDITLASQIGKQICVMSEGGDH